MTSTVTAVNQTQSLAAIRNFVRASVSCITYARGLCSDNAFEQRPFLGLPLRQLIPSTTESITISEWIEKGAFDALNRNYLKEMSLCVYDSECRELLESYCFGFNYTGNGERAQMTLNASQTIAGGAAKTALPHRSSGDVAIPAYRKRRCTKQEVQELLTSILERLMDVVESLPPLLSERVLTMRLTYYDEVTPASYEPPCFAPASDHMARLYQDEVRHHVHIGSIDSSHHLFSVAIRHPLLQQIHSQATRRTVSTAPSGRARVHTAPDEHVEAVTLSDPLRSGLESSFSSYQGLAIASGTGGATAMARVVGGDPSCRESHGGDETCAACDTASCKEEDAADSSLDEAGRGRGDAARTAETFWPCEVAKLDGVYRLVERSVLEGERSGLKPAELTYLLFAALVFAKAPSARGGRGRLTMEEVEAYRTRHCPFDVSAKAVGLFLHRLREEGFLQPSDAREAPAQRRSRVEDRSASTLEVREWLVPDPPGPLLQQLMQLNVLTALLTHESRLVLQELCVYVAREESRKAAQVMPPAATAHRRSTAGGTCKRSSR
ncbi:hypothetical protein LSCM1_00114 [Leishmania martiniquensis]|uniref:HORMA domain-containing protein n=1 Tax=Leishmania martiniquensis TaxID=1580590 RepID=A0A836K8H6_9TRYP|nr:hypothetical protein LSCM1_00114 [Leishmania martiniquensis]